MGEMGGRRVKMETIVLKQQLKKNPVVSGKCEKTVTNNIPNKGVVIQNVYRTLITH